MKSFLFFLCLLTLSLGSLAERAAATYCHNDPVNKVDVLGMAEVVTSTPEGNPVAVNNQDTFWMFHRLLAARGAVAPRPLFFLPANQPAPGIPYTDAVLTITGMGGQVRDYVKWWPQLATSMSPPDLWIMPLTARLAGDGGSRFIDSGSAGRMAAWGDVVDLRMLQAAGEATSAYPWGTLSLDEAAMGGERGYISFWDLPFGTPMTGRQNTPGAWTPIWLGTMDFAIRDNPLCTPKALAANLLASATGEGVGLWMGSLARGGAIARGGTYLSGSARLPQGLTASQFDEVAALLRGGASHIGDDIVVQGSRAAGTAGAASDMDFAIRVSPEQFNQLIVQRFGTARLGTAKGRTMLHAIETGKIQAGEAGLGGLRRLLQRQLGIDVDISIIQRGGAFDNGVTLPVP